jgi:hypothetical protein
MRDFKLGQPTNRSRLKKKKKKSRRGNGDRKGAES